jgi:hypothetical protein
VLHVCEDCVDDTGLRPFVRKHAVRHGCDFCGADMAAPIGALVEHIEAALTGQFAEAMPVAWRPGEKATWYPGTTWSTDELLWDLVGLDLRDHPKLFSALVNVLGSERRWSTADPAVIPEHERLRLNWARFCWRIKHAGRFFLLSDQRERAALEELGHRCIAFGLIRSLPRGTRLIRARRQRDRAWTTPTELGPPPGEVAVQSNRMSPPGISLFYGADDEQTALDEMQEPGTYAVAEFEVLKPATVLDLTGVPAVPSFFDVDARQVRSSILFLSRFAEEISRPIERDNRIHLEYIPTQVVTEYLRREFRDVHLLGIRYASAQRAGGVCTALFAGATAVVGGHPGEEEPDGRWLRLVRRWEGRR